jgi:[ribosomal protein S5]-alanine N-acetyltransferase
MERRDSFSLEDAGVWARRAADQTGEDRKFAVVVADRDEPIGFTALYGLFRQTAPELGILIGDRSAVTGVGRIAEALTLEKAFEDFGAHRVYGRIPARNRAAKWVVESLGWQHEATMRGHLLRDGTRPEDCEVWGVLPDEFRAAAVDSLA